MTSDDSDGARTTATVPPPHAPIVTETKAGPVDEPNRLKRGALGPIEVAASTMADIAPAMSFYFGFGFLAATSGIASPLTILVAGIAVAFLANTLSRYMAAHPSTGSFITFIGMGFGPTAAIATAIVLISGYLLNIFSIMAISGGFMTIFLNNYIHAFPTGTWPIFTLAFVGLAAYLMIRGVHISTTWASAFFVFEFVILLLVSIVAIIQNAATSRCIPSTRTTWQTAPRASASGSRWPCTCSSAGRPPDRSPRRPTNRARTSLAPCSPASR